MKAETLERVLEDAGQMNATARLAIESGDGPQATVYFIGQIANSLLVIAELEARKASAKPADDKDGPHGGVVIELRHALDLLAAARDARSQLDVYNPARARLDEAVRPLDVAANRAVAPTSRTEG